MANNALDSRDELLFDLLKGNSRSATKMKEAIYDADASQLFEEYNAKELGIKGLRLDLFYDDSAKIPKSAFAEDEDKKEDVEPGSPLDDEQ